MKHEGEKGVRDKVLKMLQKGQVIDDEKFKELTAEGCDDIPSLNIAGTAFDVTTDVQHGLPGRADTDKGTKEIK